MPGKAENDTQPCAGVLCTNCNTLILRHYAITHGRCWNCKATLKEVAEIYCEGIGG